MKYAKAIRWSLVALIIVGGVGWAVSGMTVYARLVYLGILLLVGNALWAAFSMRGIQVERTARILRASVGEVFEERFEINNSARLGCLWLEVDNQSPLPMASGSRLLTRIGARQKRFYAARTLLTRRGTFILGPTRVHSGDLFGLFTVQRQILAKDTLIVLPMTFPISTFPPPPGLLPGGKAIRQKTMDVTPHAAGIREYVPGDPMKRIHWPSTAHRGRFMVKEFEQDPQADIWLFLDAQREVHVARLSDVEKPEVDGWWLRRPKVTLPCDTFEYGVSAAASLATHFLRQRRAVGLACASGKFLVLPSDRGERQIGKLLEMLAFIQPEGSMPILGLVTMWSKLLPIGSGVIIITPSTRPELLVAVEDLSRRSLRPVVVLLKAETFGGRGDTEAIANGLLGRNVPACTLSYGDDLTTSLGLAAIYFERHYQPNPAGYVSQ